MAVYYVATTGSDSNPGSETQPFATIAHADTVLHPGDVVVVMAGTYTISTTALRTNTSGTAAQPILYMAQNPRPARNASIGLGASLNTILSSTVPYTATEPWVWDARGNYVNIFGFEVTGSATPVGIDLNGANNCRSNYHYIHDLGTAVPNTQPGAGIFDAGLNGSTINEIAYNVINNIGIQTTGGNQLTHGIYPSGSYDFVHHNIISNCAGWGIHALGDSYLGGCSMNHCIVANNLCFSNTYGGLVFASGDTSTADYMYAVNNVMVNNGTLGVSGWGIKESPNTGVNSVYDHNLTYGNTAGAYSLLNGLVATHQVTTAPVFRNYQSSGGGDYHPVRPGATIDAGTGTLPAWTPAGFGWTVDLDGVSVPQGAGYDLGPYELYATVGSGSYAALIGGSPVQVIAGSMHVENQIGQRSTGGMGVWSALGVVWQYGTVVALYDDTGALVYKGYVVKDKVSKSGAPLGSGLLEHSLTLMDNTYRADKRRAVGSYLNVTAGSIVADLVKRNLSNEGVTTTPSSVAAGLTIIEAIWNYNKSVAEAVQWLATQCGYWWQVDVNGVLWFQPYTGTPAPFVMDGTMADAMQDLSVEYGNDQYVNSQYAKGSYAEKGSKSAPLDETFHGDGARRTWTLSYPMSTLYAVILNGTDVTASCLNKGQNGGQFYFLTGDPVIAQDPSQTLLTSGDTLEIKYAGRYPIVAKAQNHALITAQAAREGGGTGLVESSYANTKLRTQGAAFQVASALLAHYGQDTSTLTFATRTPGLAAGQMLTVNLADYGLSNRQMLISGVTLSDQIDGVHVWYVVTAVGSPIETAQWQTYWSNLMQQASDPSDYTDTNDGNALALVLSSAVNWPTWTGSVTPTKTTCLICNTGTLCNTGAIVC